MFESIGIFVYLFLGSRDLVLPMPLTYEKVDPTTEEVEKPREKGEEEG